MEPACSTADLIPRKSTAGFRLRMCKTVPKFQRSLQDGCCPVLVFQFCRGKQSPRSFSRPGALSGTRRAAAHWLAGFLLFGLPCTASFCLVERPRFRGQVVVPERLQVNVLMFRFNSLVCGCFKQAADSDHHPLRKHQNPLSDFAIV